MIAGRAGPSQFFLRTLSALVLAPVALAAVWLGGAYLAALTVAAAAVMAWEWAGLCCGRPIGRAGIAVIGAICCAVLVSALMPDLPRLFGPPIGALLVWAYARIERPREAGWLALGTVWIALGCVLLLWLARRDGSGGTLFWMFAVVWATDIGAYAFGRLIGGPRLAPRWSPGKTWAGLLGGAACAAAAGWGTARLLGISPVLPLVLVSAGLAIIGQFGDLAESVAKRRFGVKDTSALIPGHGGLLDRLDGLLAVIPAVALLSLIAGGGILEWR